MMIGMPFSSVNCLEGLGSLLAAALRPGGGAPTMRVPSPAAGMITTTFMRAESIQGWGGELQSLPSTGVPSAECRGAYLKVENGSPENIRASRESVPVLL